MFGIEFTPLFITEIVFVVVMFGVSVYLGYAVSKWLKDYKIFQYIWSVIRGNTKERDRIRREQMKEAFKDVSDIMAEGNSKPTFIQKVYRIISMSGIPGVIPGFSETAFLIFMVVLNIVIFSVLSFKTSMLAGIVVTAVFDFIVYYFLQILIYTRAISVEEQIIDFVNLVASTSRQYSNIIDIFGTIYEKFKDPLSSALEECYVEAKQTNHLENSLYHLKEKFDSTQFEFVIDNLLLCSKENGQYFDVAMDLSAIANVYYSSFQKKKQILRQAKINLTIMLGLSIGIMIMMGNFIGGGVIAMVSSTSGIIICSLMLLIYLYAMNMKAR